MSSSRLFVFQTKKQKNNNNKKNQTESYTKKNCERKKKSEQWYQYSLQAKISLLKHSNLFTSYKTCSPDSGKISKLALEFEFGSVFL